MDLTPAGRDGAKAGSGPGREQSICQARAAVMVYDDANRKWVPAGGSTGFSRVHIYHHTGNNAFRVVGRKIQDHQRWKRRKGARGHVLQEKRLELSTFLQERAKGALVRSRFLQLKGVEAFQVHTDHRGDCRHVGVRGTFVLQQLLKDSDITVSQPESKPQSSWLGGGFSGSERTCLLTVTVVVINCAIPKGLKYNQATLTFHQWRDARQAYGLNFGSKEDANVFASAMMHALEVLNSQDSGPSLTRQGLQVLNGPVQEDLELQRSLASSQLVTELWEDEDKAGCTWWDGQMRMVCKLNTRTSILAATNPKGTLSPSEPLAVSVALASPLLSRFDLVLVLMDNRSTEWDRVISSFILEDRELCSASADLWTLEKMRAYFSLIKQLQPQMSEDANSILTRYYQRQRQTEGRSAARTTIRMLESLSRLAEAHSRLMYREVVTVEDAIMAVSVMDCS
ncbi:unnamed protein product, partial [Tetraodon nigroviridis]